MKNLLQNALCVGLAASALAACSSPDKPVAETRPLSSAAQAETTLMDTHDSLMARTGDLMALREKLSGYHSEAAAPYINGLATADNAMRKWMYQYKAPDTTVAAATRLAYFEAQRQQLASVRRQYNSALDSAQRFYTQHPPAGEVR